MRRELRSLVRATGGFGNVCFSSKPYTPRSNNIHPPTDQGMTSTKIDVVFAWARPLNTVAERIAVAALAELARRRAERITLKGGDAAPNDLMPERVDVAANVGEKRIED